MTYSIAFVVPVLALAPAFAGPGLFHRWRPAPTPVEGAVAVKEQVSKIPDELQPPKGHAVIGQFRAEGVQIYKCKTKKDDATAFEWALEAPDATLFDDRGEKVGTHYSGPTWESIDGSKVVGEKIASHDAPGGRAVPWLLLKAKTHEGNGALGKVTYIQRVDTWAGKPPTEGATKDNAGKLMRVKYEATYVFFMAAP